MPVNHRVEIIKILIIVVFGVNTAVIRALVLHRMVKVVGIIVLPPQYGVIHRCAGNIYPGVNIRVDFFQLNKVYRRFNIACF